MLYNGQLMAKFTLYTDGGSRGNPGVAGAGVAIMDERGQTLKTASKPLGHTTNNEAEYQAVIFGLETLKRLLGKEQLANVSIEVRLDSELVARQLQGKYQIKEATLQPLFLKVWNMKIKDFPDLKFTPIPREENKLADQLANEAMDLPAQLGFSSGRNTLL